MLKNEKGYAMPLVLMVLLVVSLLGTALWRYSTADTLQVARDVQRMQAYYLAKSGSDITIQLLNHRPSELTNMPFYMYGDLDNLAVKYGEYDSSQDNNKLVIIVEHQKDETGAVMPNQGVILATGNYNGITRELEYSFYYNATGIITGLFK